MPIDRPQLGETYWCISASDEDGYGAEVIRPWLGKISWVCDGSGRNAVSLSRFIPPGGEPDTDPNATATVYPEGLFATERAAWQRYQEAMTKTRDWAQSELWATSARIAELLKMEP
jgi:hypothetical protein